MLFRPGLHPVAVGNLPRRCAALCQTTIHSMFAALRLAQSRWLGPWPHVPQRCAP